MIITIIIIIIIIPGYIEDLESQADKDMEDIQDKNQSVLLYQVVGSVNILVNQETDFLSKIIGQGQGNMKHKNQNLEK